VFRALLSCKINALPETHLLGLVRAEIAGDRNNGGLLSASCNLQLSYAEDPIAAINTLFYPRIEYDEHAERIYIAEIDEGLNSIRFRTRKSYSERRSNALEISHLSTRVQL
jgi:hypothetical protein